MKTCVKCRTKKPLTAFSPREGKPGRRRGTCKECRNDYTRAIRKENGDRYRTYDMTKRLRRMFGMTPEEYWALFKQQGGVCAICKEPEVYIGRSGLVKLLAVDHNHATGVNRALLCHSCNCGLGNFKESPDKLGRAIRYLEEHQSNQQK